MAPLSPHAALQHFPTALALRPDEVVQYRQAGRAARVTHLLLHGIQENLSPGYLQRQRARHQKDWGGSYWWEPGADFDNMRAPDMGAAVGE